MSIYIKIRRFTERAYLLGHFPSTFSVFFSNKKKLIYYGFLGDGNFGDELVYDATKLLFKDCLVIPYQRHMPILIKLWCKYHDSKIDGVIIGGGTLLRKFNSDKDFYSNLSKLNKPLFFHGTGVDASELDVPFWQEFIKDKPSGGVRGPLSVVKSNERDYKLSEIGDAAFYFYDPKLNETIAKENVILINYGTHNYDENLNKSRLEIEKFLVSDFIKNYKIKFLPYHNIDIDLGLELIQRFPNVQMLKIPNTYDEALKEHQKASFTIGERLHFNVMSVLANTPFLSINYDEKHIDFLGSINSTSFGFLPKLTTTKVIEELFKNKDVVYDWNEINNSINNSITKQENEKKYFINKLT